MPRNALGRGLGALIREPEPQQAPTATVQPNASIAGSISTSGGAAAAPAPSPAQPAGPMQLDIDLIEPSPYQPRTRFREEALDELARSIKASGIIQPLVVRPVGNRFQLIAGEPDGTRACSVAAARPLRTGWLVLRRPSQPLRSSFERRR